MSRGSSLPSYKVQLVLGMLEEDEPVPKLIIISGKAGSEEGNPRSRQDPWGAKAL